MSKFCVCSRSHMKPQTWPGLKIIFDLESLNLLAKVHEWIIENHKFMIFSSTAHGLCHVYMFWTWMVVRIKKSHSNIITTLLDTFCCRWWSTTPLQSFTVGTHGQERLQYRLLESETLDPQWGQMNSAGTLIETVCFHSIQLGSGSLVWMLEALYQGVCVSGITPKIANQSSQLCLVFSPPFRFLHLGSDGCSRCHRWCRLW